MERDWRHFEQGEAVTLGEELPDDLIRVPLLVSVEKLQHSPVSLGPVFLSEVEDERDLPSLDEETLSIFRIFS